MTLSITPKSIGHRPNGMKFFRVERYRGVVLSKALAAVLPTHGVRFDYQDGAVSIVGDKDGFMVGEWNGMYLIPSPLLAYQLLDTLKMIERVRHYVEENGGGFIVKSIDPFVRKNNRVIGKLVEN